MELKYSQIAQLAAFSNDKMVSLIKQKLAESENAAAALVFDDKLIVLDEEKNEFYSVKYVVENRALKLFDWEPIKLIPDNDTRLESLAEKVFDPLNEETVRVKDVVEAFKLKFSNEPVKQLINKSAIEKKAIVESTSKIKALRKLREARSVYSDDIKEIFEDPKILSLKKIMSESSPIQTVVTTFDFKNPISIALFEESSDKVINISEKKKSKIRSGNIKKKVKNLWTSESFKSDFKSMIAEMAKSDDVKKVIESFVNNHKEILLVSEGELEDLVLKTSLMIGEAVNSDTITNLFKDYYRLDETKNSRENYIKRNMIVEEEGDEEGAPETAEVPEEKAGKADGEKKETTIDEDSINKILKVLNKIKESLEDKTLQKKYIESFIATLEDAKVGSIAEGKLKEILDFLSSIYEKAKSADEEE